MKSLFSGILIVMISAFSGYSQVYVIDEGCIDLNLIPEEFIDSAKKNLDIYFGHRSHGSQITAGGMTAIINYSAGNALKYAFNADGSGGALKIYEPESFPPEAGWVENVRQYLDNNIACNTVLWGWSYSVVSNGHLPGDEMGEWSARQYVLTLDSLRAEYPEVTFVVSTPISYSRRPTDFTKYDLYDRGTFLADSIIRRYALDNGLWLFDFYALSNHDPDRTNFGSSYADGSWDDQRRPLDDASYAEYITHESQNWGLYWMAANPAAENTLMAADAICTSCAHSDGEGENYRGPTANSRLQCVMKGKAAWWLWARLAGWDGGYEIVYVTDITISSPGNITEISSPKGYLQLSSQVLPAEATNKSCTWSIENVTGEATINQSGLVQAIDNGTVNARAEANDGSGVVAIFAITITNQEILVSAITLTSDNEVTTISTPGGSLQLFAEVLPVDASNPSIDWSVNNLTGEAEISSGGLVTAIANGDVRAIAASVDESNISGTFDITISGQNTLGVEPRSNSSSIQINQMQIPVPFDPEKLMRVEIINMLGQLVTVEEDKRNFNSLKLPENQKGLMLLRMVSSDEDCQTLKLWIIK